MPAALFKLGFIKRVPGTLVAGLALISFVIALSIVFRQPVKNQLHAWKLLPEPERLTELYFVHPNSLPATYTPGRTQTVSFVVHNLEYHTTTYRYQIIESSQAGNARQTLAAGIFTLRQNQYRTITKNVALVDLDSHVKLSVALTNVHEHIDYLAARSSS